METTTGPTKPKVSNNFEISLSIERLETLSVLHFKLILSACGFQITPSAFTTLKSSMFS